MAYRSGWCVLAATLASPCIAAGQPVSNLAPGQAIPRGRRVLLAQDVTYPIEGTSATLTPREIVQRHLAGRGWLASVVLLVADGGAQSELRVAIGHAARRAEQRWNGLRITVYVIHHNGGVELAIAPARSRAAAP